ncbi:MAG: sensor histidine kinase, partial [Flavobacteriaceae bacterium]|nr:sensor histidine kinase [Flavobacteriaceae bacterium]
DLFMKSLKIRDSMGDIPGVTINKLHLAEYYLYKENIVKAIKEAKESYELSSQIKNYRDKLLALKFLSKVKSDYDYANEYMELSDSLQKEERKIRNKFARIRFETDEFKERTEKLTEQKKTITTVSSIIIAMGLLLFIIWNQRMRNKKLQLEKEQQEANEEIYNLMLNQQYSVDEGRREIKKRISEELHDGVLGKLFGTRLILGTLNSAKDEESIIKREKYISDLQEVEDEIRNVSHELNEKSVMSDIGYATLIEELLEKQSIVGKFNYAFKYDEQLKLEKLSGSLQMNLYRIIQEAVQNINKYAKAENVLVEFKIVDNHIKLTIQDDGVGFDTASKSRGIGLKNMDSRIKNLHGTINVTSEKGEGTTIRIEVPL